MNNDKIENDGHNRKFAQTKLEHNDDDEGDGCATARKQRLPPPKKRKAHTAEKQS